MWGFAALVVAGLILVPLARAWDVAADLGHGWSAPILMSYLWWERWGERPQAANTNNVTRRRRNPWLVVVILASLALPLRLLLTPYPLWPMALALYVGLLVAAALIVVHRYFGWAGVCWVGGPLLLLPGVMPWPGMLDRVFVLPLREGIATIVVEASNLLGQPALAAGTSIRLAEGWVGIDEACGGIRSMHAAVTAALFFGEWTRLRTNRRVALVVVGVLAAVLGNLGRVGFLAWCAAGPEGRLEQWHDPAGWVALGFSLLLTGLIGWRWGQKHGRLDAAVTPGRNTLAGPMPHAALPVMVALIGLLAIEGATRWWYARDARIDQTGLPNWKVQLPIHSPVFERQELSDAARDMLQPDLFASGSWTEADGIRRAVNYVEWHEGQMARHAPFFHNPEICLPAAGAELIETYPLFEIPWHEGSIPFQSYHFRSMNQDLVVAFAVWDPIRGAPLRSTEERGSGWFAWWRSQWRDVANARQHQPAQLFTIALFGLENRDRLPEEINRLLVAHGWDHGDK